MFQELLQVMPALQNMNFWELFEQQQEFLLVGCSS